MDKTEALNLSGKKRKHIVRRIWHEFSIDMLTGTEKIYNIVRKIWREFSSYMLAGTEEMYSEENMA